MKKGYRYGLFSMTAGGLLIFIILYIEEAFKPSVDLVEVSKTSTDFVRVVIKFGEHLGIAFVSIGLIGIMIDLPDWQEYFQKQIAKTIIKRDFLRTLSESELISLQTDTLKAFFKVEEIDRKESFLDFFHNKIQTYIGSPYREDNVVVVSINPSQDEQSFTVEETISYRCRKVGNSIQDKVQWFTDDSGKTKLEEFKITVQVPQNLFQSSEFQQKHSHITKSEMVFDFKNIKDTNGKLTKLPEGLGYMLSLIDYNGIDGLLIKLHLKYDRPRQEPVGWGMTYPSKNLMVTIKYPPELEIDAHIFGIDINERDEEDRPGLYTLKYGSWLLPNSGLTYSLLEAKKGTVQPIK